MPNDATTVNVKGRNQTQPVPSCVGSAASYSWGVTCLLLQLGTLSSSLALNQPKQRARQHQQQALLAKHYTTPACVPVWELFFSSQPEFSRQAGWSCRGVDALHNKNIT
ncbi:hypothetical protein E2C01_001308 [Portunus trituberculatus]|uniref:Uncharacterized protein n=1 Tax=Portunus trituberculatus TaxID=210409 RepID=A0A5B7CJ22_PORTR|nr:hypothetical protein [Portunus trituberculatus]